MKLKETKSGVVQIPELLAPAGNYEKLVTAVHYGADAVYVGGKQFSLRAKATNFDTDSLREGVQYSHDHGVKVYVTVNIFAHNDDLKDLDSYLVTLKKMGVDGIIVGDPGVLRMVQKTVPNMAIHLSTQANVTNHKSASFWFDQGVSRLNLARELSLSELTEIRNTISGELEVFVHGALCISYSGRCMLSNYMTERDANRGHCSHPCRFNYKLIEEKRPGEFFPVEEDERGTYIFNSKDLCLLEKLPYLVSLGVDSIKVEGRMKSIFYVGGVVRVYRAALDYLAALENKCWEDVDSIELPQHLFEELNKTGTRGSTENFIESPPDNTDMLYYSSRADQHYEPVAVIRNITDGILVEVRNQVHVGEEIEYMKKNVKQLSFILESMMDENGIRIHKANPGNRVFITTSPHMQNGEVNGIFRRARKKEH